MMTEQELREFITEAKRVTYAGHGNLAEPSRLKSKDLPYERGPLLLFHGGRLQNI